MECRDPGAVTPEDLVQYATGQANDRVVAHIEDCAACRAQVASYADLDRTLRSKLFRFDCPEPQVLGELVLGLLAPEGALAVRSHLALCPHCAEDLATLQTALSGDPMEDLRPEPGRLPRLLARLLPSADLQSAVALRGASAGGALTYETEGLTISLSVQPEPAGTSQRWELLGLVMDETGDELPPDMRAQLLHAGQIVDETKPDEAGTIIFSGLSRGVYALELILHDRVIAVEEVDVG